MCVESKERVEETERRERFSLADGADGALVRAKHMASVAPAAFAPPRFEPSDPELLDYLEANGYAVVRAVVSSEDAKEHLAVLNPDASRLVAALLHASPGDFAVALYVDDLPAAGGVLETVAVLILVLTG